MLSSSLSGGVTLAIERIFGLRREGLDPKWGLPKRTGTVILNGVPTSVVGTE